MHIRFFTLIDEYFFHIFLYISLTSSYFFISAYFSWLFCSLAQSIVFVGCGMHEKIEKKLEKSLRKTLEE